MQGGIVSLEPLYRHVLEAGTQYGLDGRSAAGRSYGQAVVHVVAEIPDTPGFYLWGGYQANGLWRNIYLGKAGFGKIANLRTRIREELKDERCLIWRCLLTEASILETGPLYYASMWQRYEAHWNRALRKAGTSHIVWASDQALTNADIASIESDLIETLNPGGNLLHPVPPKALQGYTRDVVATFRSAVHAHRHERYAVPLL